MKINCIKQKDNRLTNNLFLGQKHMLFRTSSPTDEFHVEEMLDITNKDKPTHSYCNPLYLLLNQERIQRQGQMNLEQWLQGFNLQKLSPLQELRKRCTDQDLCKMIKSRHLQAPAEVLSWMRYMSQNMEEFSNEVKKVIEESKKTEEITTTEQVDNNSNTE